MSIIIRRLKKKIDKSDENELNIGAKKLIAVEFSLKSESNSSSYSKEEDSIENNDNSNDNDSNINKSSSKSKSIILEEIIQIILNRI